MNERDVERELHIDMVAEARDVQWNADTFLGAGCVKLVAPAKVNLFLGIGDRQPNGFHQVTTVIHAIALHDLIYMNCRRMKELPETPDDDWPDYIALGGPTDNLKIMIDCTDKGGVDPLIIPARENIMFRAIDAFSRAIGFDEPAEIGIRLEKNIPFEGGLGGGSSDAAAALLGIARLWGIDPSDPRIEETAKRIGADVAFFLYGGCSLLDGVGDHFIHTLQPMKQTLVLIKPDCGVSTTEAYATFDQQPQMIPEPLRQAVMEAGSAAEVPLTNNLAPAAETIAPILKSIRQWTEQQPGVTDVLLCGSGSTTFALVESLEAATRLTAAASLQGWWARTTSFSSLKAAIMPQS